MDGKLEVNRVVSEHGGTFTEGTNSWQNVGINFKNYYNVQATQAVIDIQKVLENNSNSPLVSLRGFEFALYKDAEGNELVADTKVVTDATGEAQIILTYTGSGDRTEVYYLIETPKYNGAVMPGMNYDEPIKVTVVVDDNDAGVLSATVDYSVATNAQGEVVVNNRYVLDAATITPEIDKHLTGRDMVANEFEFELYKLNTTTNEFEFVESKKNPAAAMADGVAKAQIQFSELSYAQVGQYYYKVVEKAGNKGGITYDSTVYYVTVTVADNGAGKLVASYLVDDMPNKEVIFRNEYDADDTKLFELDETGFAPEINKVWKNINGSKNQLAGGEFHFVIKQGNTIVGRGTNGANGKVEFIEAIPMHSC